MTYVLKLAALGIAITFGAVAADQAEAREGRPGFEALDTNNDGQLTRAEMEAHRAVRFADTDTNGDGLLSLEELQAKGEERAQKRAARMMDRLDANDDGLISEEELSKMRSGRMGRMFDRVDSNGDGSISKAEFDTARQKMEERRKN